MQELPIEYIKEALEYFPDTGELKWKARPKSHFRTESGWKSANARYTGKKTGSPNTYGYLQVGIDGRLYLAHRLAWAIQNGAWPNGEIDHISGVRSDNRMLNLRVVNTQDNCKNKRIYSANTSGVIGVSWYKSRQKWRAKINVGGKVKHVGYFATIEQAETARKKAEEENQYHLNHGNCLA